MIKMVIVLFFSFVIRVNAQDGCASEVQSFSKKIILQISGGEFNSIWNEKTSQLLKKVYQVESFKALMLFDQQKTGKLKSTIEVQCTYYNFSSFYKVSGEFYDVIFKSQYEKVAIFDQISVSRESKILKFVGINRVIAE